MATRSTRTNTSAPTFNLATLSGFYAAFDAQFQAAQDRHQWCGDGMRQAYRMGVPSPDRRPAAIQPIPAEYLTEAGQAWQAAAQTEGLDACKLSVREGIVQAMRDGNLAVDEGNEVLTALGLPIAETTTRYAGSLSLYGSFHTTARVDRDTQASLSQALRDAANATVAAWAAENAAAFTISPYDGYDTVVYDGNVASDRYADTRMS